MIGIRGFQELHLTSMQNLHSTNPGTEGLGEGSIVQAQTATSSPCPGSHMLAVISNWTNSMPFSTMIPKWNGSGVTIESRAVL